MYKSNFGEYVGLYIFRVLFGLCLGVGRNIPMAEGVVRFELWSGYVFPWWHAG